MKIVETKKRITCSPVHVITRIVSEKNGDRVATMSRNERNVGGLLESLSCVGRYDSQPFTIELYMDGVLKRYTPDFCVFFTDDAVPLVLEVKPARFLEDLYLQRKLAIVARGLPSLGYRFAILTEKQIPTLTEYQNLRFLFSHRSRLPSESVIGEVLELVQDGVDRAFSLDDFIQRHDDEQSSIYSLIAHGILYADMSQPINHRTQLKIAGYV